MHIIAHRINSIKDLRTLPSDLGVEIDVRAWQSDLVLHHDPFIKGDLLKDYLEQCKNRFIVFNIKEAGIEDEVHRLALKYGLNSQYFLLDVEFPYIYRAAREGERRIAMRFSEDESMETANKYAGKVDWLWIDTNTILPIDEGNISALSKFKTCLVCPERWGRPQDIASYRAKIDRLGFKLDAVMTSIKHVSDWR